MIAMTTKSSISVKPRRIRAWDEVRVAGMSMNLLDDRDLSWTTDGDQGVGIADGIGVTG
jgi:hypothetical protein